ncbi:MULTISPECIES: hypothetical protein [Pseudomonas]|uniref:hypothetical protein n=1 Tax=Pseudomonas TaxID=286 RepID=UPI00047845FB|nr:MULTISPECIES: hypothetical protein [Pseudomonas]ROM42618.1 glycosyltransferase [Pseudomonas protegens]URN87510.1 MAG: glycosyltransferase [Pseudomonas protegens]UVM10007.1 glycosyltransferase [Pseudomonas protegens]WEK25599.1 MAG: glycosyltransferase [Pseudomonas protegens]SCZ59735.1 hypothetical protein SAMN03159460_01349 [Pseudomonas sp. NFPP17]
MEYLFLIVIYNRSLKDSQSICSLIKSISTLEGSTFIIWDNSLEPQAKSQLDWLSSELKKNNFIYKHTPENKSLSEIYNSFLTLAPQKKDFIILLDHDTSFDLHLFTAHREALNDCTITNLYLPIVKFKNKIVSPGKQVFFKSLPYKNLHPGLMPSRHNTAINSGMIIRWSYFTETFKGYDKRLKFYGTDDYFMMQYRKTNKSFYLLDYTIEHDLTCDPEADDIYKFRSSFQEAQKSFLILHSNGRTLSMAGLVVFIRRLKHTIKFKINFFS